jgi:hypothetical protein
VKDLLSETGSAFPKVRMGMQESYVELLQEKVETPLDFSRVIKAAFKKREADSSKAAFSHLYISYS